MTHAEPEAPETVRTAGTPILGTEARTLRQRLEQWVGRDVVIDCVSPYVAIGKLAAVGDDYVELHRADMHDLRDSSSTREVYLAKRTGPHAAEPFSANRRVLLFRGDQIVGVSRLADVTVE